MNDFSNKNSDMLIKMFVHQFGLTVFGFLLYSAASVSGNTSLLMVFGVFSALFYMFLLYVMTWDKGASDIIRVNGKRMKYDPLRGLKVSFLANIPNLVLATVATVGYAFVDKSTLFNAEIETAPTWAANMFAIAQLIGMCINMMYTGIADYLGVMQLPYVLYLFVIPSLLACSLGYYFGTKNILGLPSSPKQNKR